jgi:hypothetical protein
VDARHRIDRIDPEQSSIAYSIALPTDSVSNSPGM